MLLSSEDSSSDSGPEASTQALPQRGTERKCAFEPPQGAVLMGSSQSDTGAIEAGEFDWNSIKDEKNIELWLIRIPDSIKPKRLDGAVFNAPSSSSTQILGQVMQKHGVYDLWSLGDHGENDVDHDQIGGDEMRGLSCLLPRKSRGGKLYLGPKPITRRLVLAASPPALDDHGPAVLHQNPPRHSYPTEMFKHRYTPYGSTTSVRTPPAIDLAMDVDQEGNSPTTTLRSKKRSKHIDDRQKTTKKAKAMKP